MKQMNISFYRIMLAILVPSIFFMQNTFAQNINTRQPVTFHLILSQKGSCKTDPSPLISNGVIYIGDYSGIVSAISQYTSRFLWRSRFNNNCILAPVSDADSIYFTTAKTALYRINKTDGSTRWISGWGGSHEDISRPVVNKDLIYYGDNYQFTAVDKNTGEDKWDLTNLYLKFSAPLVYESSLIVGGYDGYFDHPDRHGIYSLNKQTGEIQWTFDGEHHVNENGMNEDEGFHSPPCELHDTIYAASSFGNVYALDANNGKKKWIYKIDNNPSYTSPVCFDNTVYVATQNILALKNALYAIDASSGKLKWQFKTNGRVSIPRINRNTIYFGSADYSLQEGAKPFLYAVDINTGNLKWKFEPDADITGEPITNSGIIYFMTTAGSLYAIDEDTGNL